MVDLVAIVGSNDVVVVVDVVSNFLTAIVGSNGVVFGEFCVAIVGSNDFVEY